jgi:hypothetical protein
MKKEDNKMSEYKIDRWDVIFYISMAVLVGWIIAKVLGYCQQA